MKKTIKLIPGIVKQVLASSLLSGLVATVNAQDIQFEISGVNSDQGKLYVQLYKGAQNYQNNQAEFSSMLKPKKGVNTITFNNVEPGEYAIRYFHDADDSGKLEFNLFGMPIEGYGFSNDAIPDFGPPDYQQIKFAVTNSATPVSNQSTVIY